MDKKNSTKGSSFKQTSSNIQSIILIHNQVETKPSLAYTYLSLTIFVRNGGLEQSDKMGSTMILSLRESM